VRDYANSLQYILCGLLILSYPLIDLNREATVFVLFDHTAFTLEPVSPPRLDSWLGRGDPLRVSTTFFPFDGLTFPALSVSSTRRRCVGLRSVLGTVWSTVPSVRHHPGLGRDGNSPSVPGTLPTFGSWTGTDGKDGRGRISSVPGSPRRSSIDIHGLCSMYIIKII
jgi:hypothetical protein